MSQNKYMHHRNIYRNPPNFKELAITYPEFRKYAKQDIKGKVTLDFKDQEALRALTKTLLHKDFGLQVEIPANRLVPTLPLRLNYLLWIEDIMENTRTSKEQQIFGVDIGTGASCIYPLLAVKTQKWKMLATELDIESVNYARRNVESNGLMQFITVKQVESGTILKGALDMKHKYDFTMCNPPFFSNEKEADSSTKSRSDLRPLPHNVRTGSIGEVVVHGGERSFILQMIQEIFSTMVGQKFNLKYLKSELEKVGVVSSIQTEFCQGHTTRWGLAWTFVPHLNLERIQQSKRKKEKPPMKYVVPAIDDPNTYTVSIVTEKVLSLFKELQIEYKSLKGNAKKRVIEIMAEKNTWSHQRRKRREQKTQQTVEENEQTQPEQMEIEHELSNEKIDERLYSDDTSKGSSKRKLNLESDIDIISKKSIYVKDEISEKTTERLFKEDDPELESSSKTHKAVQEKKSHQPEQMEVDVISCSDDINKRPSKRKLNLESDANDIIFKKIKYVEDELSEETNDRLCKEDDQELESSSKTNSETITGEKNNNHGTSLKYAVPESSSHDKKGNRTCFLKAILSVSNVDSEIHIEMAWLEGLAGREAVHQVLQYIKNNLKIGN
ncbi:hypothetical protein C0J52_04676 [Blattella germanica]|nr:hypothetical protein C0J52_04676 [Blattella germanica]